MFIYPRGTLFYHKMLFGLKNASFTFQWAISYTFHDIKHIVEVYLDDLTTHSHKRTSHIDNLCAMFNR